ncbi:MFS transporter [Terricaulis sp.]|uniref:MFS transporter n=1 Tax=Terricaulis sp. TaxID=2768686 RepID=UPI003783CDFB
MSRNERKVSGWDIAAFAAPAAPLLALSLPTIIFIPPYFASHLGIPLVTVSAIFFCVRLADIVIDPSIGSFQDRTEHPWGRRRFWLTVSCAPLMALIWFIFIGLWPGVSVAIAAAAVFLLYLVYASMMLAHLGWAGELIPTYHGRTRVLGAVQIASAIGQVLMLGIAGYVAQTHEGPGRDAAAVAAMGWTMILLLPIATLLTVAIVPEAKGPAQQHLTLRDTIKTLFESRAAQRVLLPDFLLGVAQGVSGALFLFYFQFVLGFERESQTLLAIYFASALLGVPVWWLAAQRFGKHRALQGAFIYTAATTALLMVLPPHEFMIAAPFMVAAGMANGGGVLLTRSLMADVVDEDELTTGTRRSGLFFGLLLTTSKVGVASGPLALGVLGLVGFHPAAGAENSAQALDALTIMFIGVPIVLCLLGTLTLRNYPLDAKRQAELHAAIEARHAENRENTAGPSTR